MFVTTGRVREALSRTGVRLGAWSLKDRANRGSHFRVFPGSVIWQKYSAGLEKGFLDKGVAKFAHGSSTGEKSGLALTEARDAGFP